jgi:hypothetical protein
MSTVRSRKMRGVVMHKAGDVRVEEREDPRIVDRCGDPADCDVYLWVGPVAGPGGGAR